MEGTGGWRSTRELEGGERVVGRVARLISMGDLMRIADQRKSMKVVSRPVWRSSREDRVKTSITGITDRVNRVSL